MTTNPKQAVSEDSLDQACAWVVRLRSGSVSAADHREFSQWITYSEENHLAFSEITELWGDLGALSHLPIDQLFPESAPSQNPSASDFTAQRSALPHVRGYKSEERLRALPKWLIGGGLATCGAVIALWVGYQGINSQPQAQIFVTERGQVQTIDLSDGSEVKLNSNSELRVIYSRKERRTQLVRGEAFFEVARQTSRPFTVVAGSANIRVLGTEFNVELNPENTRVSVVGGTVSVSEASSAAGLKPESVQLVKNQKVSVSDRGLTPIAHTSPEEATDWTRGTLVFERTPLKDALMELNRYLSIPATASPQVENRLISGTFEISDPDNTLKAIATALDLQQDHSDSNLTILSPTNN
ncbi:FecR domain-containing protein [Microbulbifer sp. OS29]|uniref:FecR domain-containing protein n=1 Tax=Microbulbifer okhotskensis TaxID=2926617 RepID=A0A9X2EL15_9GAMM|nr:FecR domain-containing protein [Microbulbifer okhotskensis]MCO1333626.1 FecR domain-containing protein [Microbulbifer okhotskensis]